LLPLAAFSRLDDERATLYGDLVFLHLSVAARAALTSLVDVVDAPCKYPFDDPRRDMRRWPA